MGKQNNLWHDFLQDKERYADLINAFGMNGNQVVKPEDIKDADSKSRDKSRDEVRKIVFGINFAMIGIESQETIDYSLVVRNMYYDAISYDNERKRICRLNANSKNDLKDGELLYLFRKDDKLHPVVTFVVYCGKEPWDASKSILDMLDTTDIPKELLDYVPNYNINVIDIRRSIDRLSELRTDVKDVLEFIAYSDDLSKLRLLTASNTRYMNMKEDAYLLTKEYAHIDNLKPAESEKGAINMCKALEDLRIESINIGKILAHYEDGISIQDIAKKTGQTVDFVKDTLRENNLIEK